MFDYKQYIPCLRWKMGEYQAIWRLSEKKKKMLTPIIEVPEFDFDFEKRKKPKTMDEHLGDFSKNVCNKWGKASCFVDMKRIPCSKNMENGKNPIAFIFDGLLERECSFIPVTGLDRDKTYQDEIKKHLTRNRSSGLCLRIIIEEFAKSELESKLSSLLTELKIKLSETHLVIDLGEPNFIPLDGFAKAIRGVTNRLSDLNKWQTFSILGTSFPQTIKKGTAILPRYEWQLYKKLIPLFAKEKLRLPAFGDYAIAHLGDIPDLDWRIIKPAATIRYTIDDSWYISKGQSLRDGPPAQCHDMSRELVKSGHFCGADFSFGDQFIQNCATDKTVKTRSLTMWRQVGTNHHLEKVVRDIANFHASLKFP